MEEASLAFSVEDAEEVSDEEDDQQRKAELHQLLTEQLQDDLLDDSVSTVTTEGGMADSTLLGDEVGVSLDHVISPNQSRDFASLLNGSTNEGQLVSHDSGQHDLKLSPTSSEQVAPSADLPPPPSQPTPVAGCALTEVSDVFSSTAQAYSILQPSCHTAELTTHPVNTEPETGSLSTDPHTNIPPGRDEQPVPLESRGRGQMEVLYGARCRQVEVLSHQLQAAREEGEVQSRILQHEKSQLERQLSEAKDRQRDLECHVQSLTQQLHEMTSASRAAKAEQEEMCAMLQPPSEGGSGDLAGRLVELSTQKEDLQYQLSCCQGQLETHVQRAESAEMKISRLSEELSFMRSEVMSLREEVTRLKEEGARERENAELDKREALEKCRMACLQLHGDATERLKEAMAAEKQSLLQDHLQQITSLQQELSAVQEEYVRLCGEKDKMKATHTKNQEQAELELKLRADQLVQSAVERERIQWVKGREMEMEEEVRVAVERAREEWRQTLAEESRQSVEIALSSARQQWQARMAVEVEGVRAAEKRERDAAITAAVAAANEQWQSAQQEAIQAAVEETREQCSESVLTVNQVHSMLQATIAAVKSDVRHALQEVIRVGEERERQAAARSRLATAEEMKSHYLNCLHMMVNTGADGNGQITPTSAMAKDSDTVVGMTTTSLDNSAQRVCINKGVTSKKVSVRGAALRNKIGGGPQKGSVGMSDKQTKLSVASRQSQRRH